MAGYDWNKGKSNNAVIAENEGKFPLSKIKKSDLVEFGIDITLTDAKLLAKNDYWKPSEWHHTSKYFNTTYYYDLCDLQSIVKGEDYALLLSEIKAKMIAEEEDIIYAQIEITEFYKSRARWVPEKISMLAEVRNYNGPGDYCTYNFNRKKKSNIDIIYKMSKEDYNLKIEEIELLEKRIKKEKRLTVLKNLKNEVIEQYAALLEKYSNNEQLIILIQKVKNARTIKAIRILKASIIELINTLNDAIVSKLRDTCIDGIDLTAWVLLPQEARHPAPQSVVDAKVMSGLSWNAFERKLKGVQSV